MNRMEPKVKGDENTLKIRRQQFNHKEYYLNTFYLILLKQKKKAEYFM